MHSEHIQKVKCKGSWKTASQAYHTNFWGADVQLSCTFAFHGGFGM